MPIFASNFASNSLTGVTTVVAGNVTINLSSGAFALEGDKAFVVKLRKGSSQGAVVATSPVVTIKDRTTFVSLTANTATVAEGNLVSFSLVTTNVVNGATVYYSVLPATANVTADDFTGNTGSAVITNNAATFALKANADVSLVDETGENFRVQLRTNSPTGNIVFATSNVEILDTYKTYNIIGVTAGNVSPIVKGKSEIFTFIATNVPNGTLFYYNTTGNVASFTSNTGSFALNGTSNVFAITNPQLTGTANAFYNVVVRSESAVGAVVATSNTMVVNYTPPESYLWSWGSNGYGQLGLGNTTSYSSPKQIGALTTWSTIAGGRRFCAAIKTDGTVWTWGQNSYAALGLGDTTNRSSPVQVGALTNWSKINAGGHYCATIKTDGTMWSWGKNDYGQLGLGNITYRSSPVQIGALTNWLTVSAGYTHCTAIKTDGTLWGWGLNSTGQLGLTDETNRSSPVQIGSLTTWLNVSAGYQHSLAIKTDGTLWGWGNNYFGELGLGNTTNRSSPVQIGALTTWLTVSAGNQYTMAIKTDGTLWSSGRGSSGKLGLGNTTYYSSPKQVGSLTNWSGVSAGGAHTLAIKTDNTLWSWGGNDGRLGQGNTTDRSSPVQVGALTNWSTIASGTDYSISIG